MGGGGFNLLFGIIFAENWMEIEKKMDWESLTLRQDPPKQMIKKVTETSTTKKNPEKLGLDNLRYHRMLKKKNQHTVLFFYILNNLRYHRMLVFERHGIL